MTAIALQRAGIGAKIIEAHPAGAAERCITIIGGRRVTHAEREGRAVVATLSDGSTERADSLIGADGVHSTIRRLIDPQATRERYVGLTNFGGPTRESGVRESGVEIKPASW